MAHPDVLLEVTGVFRLTDHSLRIIWLLRLTLSVSISSGAQTYRGDLPRILNKIDRF